MPERHDGSVSGELSQRTTTAAQARTSNISCNGAAQPWSIAFTPLDGKFKGGPADVMMGVSVCCLPFGGVGQTVIQSAILRGVGRRPEVRPTPRQRARSAAELRE